MTENDYRADVAAKGYGEPIPKTWDADYHTDVHTHDRSAYLLIKEGTAALGIETAAGTVSTTLQAGSTIEVPAGCQHFEQASGSAVRFLVATK